MSESTDPYTYPGTNVLRNLRDIQDPEILARFEAESSTWRIAQLIHASLKGRFDVAHFKAIHKHVFQDVYPWAGEFRTVNISKDDHLFAVSAFVEPALEELLQMLAGEDYLARSKTARFAARAGSILARSTPFIPFERATAARRENLFVS
ncbi:MAG TPA: Fic family protein, partial [Bryobacteraceae bacterium]|nr:Fic family protein [Bryobacteraceae bacterium]